MLKNRLVVAGAGRDAAQVAVPEDVAKPCGDLACASPARRVDRLAGSASARGSASLATDAPQEEGGCQEADGIDDDRRGRADDADDARR